MVSKAKIRVCLPKHGLSVPGVASAGPRRRTHAFYGCGLGWYITTSGDFRPFPQQNYSMPTLPIVLSHGQRHTRYNRRALTTAPKPRGRQPVYVEPLQACAERWIALARRYKIAMFGIAGAVIAVYCPPNPFQSARAKHAHLGAHYPARYKPSESRCAFSRARCPEVCNKF